MSEHPHQELIDAVIEVASAVEPKVGKHLDSIPEPDEDSGRILDDSTEEWLLDALEAARVAADGRGYFHGRTALQWAERIYQLCDLLKDGDELGLAIADKIVDELAPHFGTDDG